jgi:hypothetical protein
MAPLLGSVYEHDRCTSSSAIDSSFYTVRTIGSATFPTLTGLFVQYTLNTWRNICWVLTALGTTALLLQILFVPDTAHHPSPYSIQRVASGKSWICSWEAVNVFKCLRMLKNPRITYMVGLECYPFFEAIRIEDRQQSLRYFLKVKLITGCICLGSAVWLFHTLCAPQ